jgi:hypothetical protein
MGFCFKELCNSPRIVGFDIHPFACLIAQVRFMLELIPFYKKAIEEEKIVVQTSLQRLPIFRTDSLLIEMKPSEIQRGPKLLVTEEDLRFLVPLPIKINSEKMGAVKVMIPSWKKTLEGTNYSLFNLDEYFCVIQAIFDVIKVMVKVEAEEVPIKALTAHIKKYISDKDFDVVARFFKPYADHILSEIKRLQKEIENGRLIKSIEDAVLSALLKNYIKYDFVVGNPPYVRVQKLTREVRNYYHDNYVCARGKFDIYLLFIERGIKWLEKSGKLGYICSNQFLMRDYGKELKKQIRKSCIFRQLIDFGDSGVFSDVTNYPCIIILEKGTDSQRIMSVARVAKPLVNQENREITLDYIRENIEKGEFSNDYLDIFKLKQSTLGTDIWEIMPEHERKVFHRILKNSNALFKDVREQIFEGFISGANNVFFVDNEKICAFNLETNLLRRVPKGKDVRRWKIVWKNRYVIYPHKSDGSSLSEDELKSNYPNIYAYLGQHKNALKRRKYYGKTPEELHGTWFALVHPKPEALFTAPKIIVPNLSTRNDFAFDPQGEYYVDHDCYGITLKSKEKSNYLYMLGLLNSHVLEFFLKHISPYASGKYYRYMTGYIDQLPIKLPQTLEEKKVASHLISKVEDILTLLNLRWLTEDFPNKYIERYASDLTEFDEIKHTFSKNYGELLPILTKQEEKGYVVFPHKGEDPLFIETEEKALYLVLALKGKSVKQNEEVKILIPRDNSVVAKIINDLQTKLKALQKFSIEQIEKEINEYIYHLYDLDENDKAVIEDFLKKF